jgi:glycosyltransferase involved in cell wall biosynthesis
MTTVPPARMDLQGLFVKLVKQTLKILLPPGWIKSLNELKREKELIDRNRVILFDDQGVLPTYTHRRDIDPLLLSSRQVKVTLVSTCLNEAKTAQNWLQSLEKQSRCPDEMIITDGGSCDGTVEIINKFAEGCRFKITLLQAPGANISKGRNLAIQQARNPVIVVTDFGCVYEQDWIARLVYPYEVDKEIDLSFGYYQAIVTRPFEGLSANFLIRKLENVDPQTFLPSSRCIAFSKEIWAMVAGYPEWLTNEGEDTLFDYQLKQVRTTSAFVPSARVSWHPPGSLGKIYKTFWRYARGDAESGISSSTYWYFISAASLWGLGLLFLLALSFCLGSISNWTRLGLGVAWLVFMSAWVARAFFKILERPRSFGEFIQVWAIAVTIFTARIFGFLRGLLNRPAARRRWESAIKARLQEILETNPDRQGIILYPATHDWGFMFQRPHQMARAFAQAGYLFFYCTDNQLTDGIQGFYPVERLLYVCNVPMQFFRGLPDSVLYIGSAWHRGLLALFEDLPVIYDHYDDIEVSAAFPEDHQALLTAAKLVLVSSQALWDNVKVQRPDAVLVLNAVDYDFIQKYKPVPHEKTPEDLVEILAQGKPLVGYSGVLSEWFDYDLLKYSALSRPGFEFVLIGVNYDQSLDRSGVLALNNVHWLGMKPYSQLFQYTWRFDIGIIPFKINKMTLAMSPLKQFEYMACRLPIVSTALPECKRYPEILVAETQEQFVELLDTGLRMKMDEQYLEVLEHTARENTWESRVKQIIARLNK